MSHQEEQRARRKVRVDLNELSFAFDDGSWEANSYLDLEAGEVIRISDEIRREMEDIFEEIDDEDGVAFAEELERRDLPDWEEGAIKEAALVEAGYGTRYISIPRAESSDGYDDMEGFITTVRDHRLQDLLSDAIGGRGAFRRFKDVLARHTQERERWFEYKDARLRERVLEWLEEEGIEPILVSKQPPSDL